MLIEINIVRQQMKLFIVLITQAFSFSVNADWKQETLGELSTFLYYPKTSSIKAANYKRALMINLHGCSQKADDLKSNGNWEKTADTYDMIVALPKVPNGGVYMGCWDYYGDSHTETNRHNGAIIGMIKALLARPDLNIDANQIYVSGLSSGGGESMILGCMVPDLIAGMGLNAGPSTGTSANEISRPQTTYDKMLQTCKKLAGNKFDAFKTQLTSIIYGNNDYVVSTQYDLNNAEIMRSIYGANNKSTFDTKKLDGAMTDGTGTMFSDSIGPRVSLIMNTNLGHNWPSGQGGNGGAFINKKSINYPLYLTKFFFENNRRASLVNRPEIHLYPIKILDNKFYIDGEFLINPKEINKVIIDIIDPTTKQIIQSSEATINGNAFNLMSNELKDGLYDLDFHIYGNNQRYSHLKRDAWIGEIPGLINPQLVNVEMNVVHNCINLKGQAIHNGVNQLIGVEIILDGQLIGSLPVDPSTFFSHRFCNINTGNHQLILFAKDEALLESNYQMYQFSSDLNSAYGTVQNHMEAGRLKWQDYGVWFARYSHQAFNLYRQADGSWSDILP